MGMTDSVEIKKRPEPEPEYTEEQKATIVFLDRIIEFQAERLKAGNELSDEELKSVERCADELYELMREEMFLEWLLERKRRVQYPHASAFTGRTLFGGGGFV